MPSRIGIGDLPAFIATAQTRADPIVASLVARPTLGLMTLYVARAELLRVARLRVGELTWPAYLESLARLEQEFDRRVKGPIERVNRQLITVALKVPHG